MTSLQAGVLVALAIFCFPLIFPRAARFLLTGKWGGR